MLPLVIFICLVIAVAVAMEVRERRRKASKSQNQDPSIPLQEKRGGSSPRPEGCCGEHLVCEKETLLITKPEIVYYDDEELDALSGIDPTSFTPEQHDMISEVFVSLREEDVAGWCRSLQMRGIELPQDIREQALLIVKERRNL